MSLLFTPLSLRGVTFKNRVFMSPMCQYSAVRGVPQDWHLVHLTTRAVGGVGLVLAEATAVSPEGRISPDDTGLWDDEQAAAWARIGALVKQHGASFGVQLAHAGRKASTAPPWKGGGTVHAADGGWQPVAPSALAFSERSAVPAELTEEQIGQVIQDFASAAVRAHRAGFEVIELHMAHGYLIHEFLSPLSNRRTDGWGGDLQGRVRLACEVAKAVRAAWPDDKPLMARLSATDWVEGGWDLASSVRLSKELKAIGVDLIDCSSGGLAPHAKVPVGPGYQARFAEAVRAEAAIPTAAVGMITEPVQAEHILRSGQADAVMLARQLLREPYWPLRAARVLGATTPWPVQYERARD